MPEETSTLKVGDRAPGFELDAANRAQHFHLDDVLKHGPVIVEFLRGTW